MFHVGPRMFLFCTNLVVLGRLLSKGQYHAGYIAAKWHLFRASSRSSNVPSIVRTGFGDNALNVRTHWPVRRVIVQ